MGRKERGDCLRILSRISILMMILIALLWISTPAAAQKNSMLHISAPKVDSFPAIHFGLDAYDAQGNFLDNLIPTDVQIVEDGQTLSAQSVEKVQAGLQTIIVLNTSPAMANPSGGMVPYKTLQKALVDWANQLAPQSVDDYSFSTPSGLSLTREHDPAQVAKAFSDYQPDLTKIQPSLSSLAQALDLATDPLGQSATRRAVLYITPTLPANTKTTLTDLTNRAKDMGVQVNVWLVSRGSTPTPAGTAADPLQQLAQATGGQYQVLLPNADLPPIDPLFQPLRSTYQVSYNSGIQKGGQHTLSVRLTQAGLSVDSNQTTFNLDVQPPNPIFLSPPTTLERSWTSTAKNEISALSPDEVPLQILVDFPDHHQRDIKATRLYVNNTLVQENTTAPFNQFTWSVSNIEASGRMMLRVEAVDVLGLTGTSAEIPVDVTVAPPLTTGLSQNISRSGMIAIAAIAAAGGVLAMVLILTGTQRRLRRRQTPAEKKRLKDPLTQPVAIHQDHTRRLKGKSAANNAPSKPDASWPVPSWPLQATRNALARLILLDDNEQPVTDGIILLTRQEITFGKDPQRATQVLDSPTVDDLHARLYRDEEGHFYLADQGSVAGTWINFAPVTSSGARLEHGDLIHIGKMVFRFELTDPNQVHQPDVKVTHLDIKS